MGPQKVFGKPLLAFAKRGVAAMKRARPKATPRLCLVSGTVAVVLLVSGCLWFVPADGWTYVQGNVVDEQGLPLSEVKLTLFSDPSGPEIIRPICWTTDEYGRFEMGVVHEPRPCTFILEARKQGYRPVQLALKNTDVNTGLWIVLVRESEEPPMVPDKAEP